MDQTVGRAGGLLGALSGLGSCSKNVAGMCRERVHGGRKELQASSIDLTWGLSDGGNSHVLA